MLYKLKISVGREVITPPIGSLLGGYIPPRVCEKINDDLTVTAVAFEYGPTKSLILSATLGLIETEMSIKIRNLISDKTGVPFENIIFAATHTHSGTMNWSRHQYYAGEEYNDTIFIPGAIKAAEDAVSSLKYALVGIGRTHSDVGINRRQINLDGRITLGQNPWGYYDPVMTVISFKSEEGKPIANIIHYGAHCTGAGKNPEVTRDWAGPMIDRLEQQSGAVTMFVNGAEGDVGPRLSNGLTTGEGDIGFALELGAKAAIDAVRAYRSIKEYSETDMKVINDVIKLPYAPLIPFESVKKEMTEYKNVSELCDWELLRYKHLKGIFDEYEKGSSFKEFMYLNQTIIKVGHVVFVPFTFEIFAEMTLRLREYSPYQHTLCLSNANGCDSYFPTQDQMSRGGYEVDTFKMMNVYTLRDDADNYIISENIRLLNMLYKKEM